MAGTVEVHAAVAEAGSVGDEGCGQGHGSLGLLQRQALAQGLDTVEYAGRCAAHHAHALGAHLDAVALGLLDLAVDAEQHIALHILLVGGSHLQAQVRLLGDIVGKEACVAGHVLIALVHDLACLVEHEGLSLDTVDTLWEGYYAVVGLRSVADDRCHKR